VCVALSTGCSTPAKTMNWLTPDRVGYGISHGTMTGLGVGNKTMRNQEEPLELDFNGDSQGSMIWLEWDLPSWKQPNERDRYTRAKIRDLNYRMSMMEAEDRNNKLLDEWLRTKSYER